MPRTNGLFASIILGSAGVTGRVLTGAAAVMAIAGHATADIKAVQSYHVVVTRDNIPLKCSDGNIYYAVRMLKTNDVLRVDGSGNGWLRVEYPAGTRAYVKSDEATFDEASKTLKLTRPSKLMSANVVAGTRPWWYLLDQDVPAGASFANAEPVKSADGTLEGYLVAAPAAARGYVREEAVRTATAEEVRNSGVSGAPAELLSNPATATPAVAAAPAPTPAPAPVTATPAPTAAATAPVVATPMTSTPTTTPTATEPTITMSPTPAPGTTEPAAATPATTPVAPVAVTPPTATRRVEDTETLRNMFDNVMQGPGNEAEVATVISEFNRSIDNLGNSDQDAAKRRALRSRVDALRLRQEVLDMRRRITDTDAQFSEKIRQTTVAIQEVEKQAIYTIVGRIVPSTVYDGRRGLPLMYRVEAADASSTRTIGYVVPRDGVDLLPKMGKVVGIVGEAKMDDALGLNIVAPRRVDSLEIVGGRYQVVTDSQTTTNTNITPGGTTVTTTTTKTVTTSGNPALNPAQPEPGTVPVAQPNEQPDMNK